MGNKGLPACVPVVEEEPSGDCHAGSRTIDVVGSAIRVGDGDIISGSSREVAGLPESGGLSRGKSDDSVNLTVIVGGSSGSGIIGCSVFGVIFKVPVVEKAIGQLLGLRHARHQSDAGSDDKPVYVYFHYFHYSGDLKPSQIEEIMARNIVNLFILSLLLRSSHF